MSLKRVSILLGKEFLQGPKSFIFVWAIVAPIVISLVVTLIFGTFFTEKPKLGIIDEGSSQLVTLAEQLSSITTREYDTVSGMKQAVERGAVDIGMVLPADFDSAVIKGEKIEITTYIWGESLAKNRTILAVTVANLIRELTGQDAPVEIETITLGNELNIPWNDRLLPFIVLMSVFLGGIFLPATSVINEKVKKTLDALVITPTSVGDIFLAKGLLGIILSLFMGTVILLLNQAFGAEPALLLMILVLGTVMAAEIGLLLGALVKDITTLFAIWKFGGVLLFAPALIYLFPQIPQWIGRIFPTYYLIQPIVELSQQGSGWPEIAMNVFILIGLDLVLIGAVIFALRKSKQFAT
jgi:ABC-2 type transport system permease protein